MSLRLSELSHKNENHLKKSRSGSTPVAKSRIALMSLIGAVAVSLAACSSNTNSSATTTATTAATKQTTASTAPGASLSSLEAKAPSSSVSLQETGSSLLYPLFNLWVTGAMQKFPTISVTTASTGSGTGFSAAATGQFRSARPTRTCPKLSRVSTRAS
jgi:ABC-type phosphate transport system substrate-binding protein